MDVAAMTGSLAACAVMAAAAAVTGWRIDAASRRDAGADDYFWIAFGGIVVIAGGGVAAATMSGAGALLAVLTGVGACAAAAAWAWRRHAQRARAARESAHSAAWGELRRRHDAIIRQWADYDVDPAKAIRYPAMHDPGHPAARPVVRALRAAGDEGNPESGGRRDGRDLQRYADAVARLERTFDAAERELGELGTRRPARHREASGRF